MVDPRSDPHLDIETAVETGVDTDMATGMETGMELDIDPDVGLDASEAERRRAAGLANIVPDPPGRSLQQVVRANVLTPVNAIMLVLFALILVSGYWRDGLFVGVVVSNSVVGIVQEVRARRELARLEVVTAATTTVIRSGEAIEVATADVVLGDIVEIRAGDQLVVDGIVRSGVGLQLDESMLTGESEPVDKTPGGELLSGSFVVAGSGRMSATAVGADSYAAHLATEAKTFDDAESMLRSAVDRILRWLTFIIPLASIGLLISLLDTEDRWQDALQGTVAAAVAMVPDGLVLLTSLAFVAGMLELARRNALAKQLTTVEVLARVDALCVDKTGTITSGRIEFGQLHSLGGTDAHLDEATEVLANLALNDPSPNATMAALADRFAGEWEPARWRLERFEPFSSARKWSAARFDGHGWYYLGAPDFLLAPGDPGRVLAGTLSATGQRLLALVASDSGPDGDTAPSINRPVALVELHDEIRPDAAEIFAYFADQGVTIKVISGDNHETVAAIARRAGLEADDATIDAVDARTLPDDAAELGTVLEDVDVFGRVTPKQKQAMVTALQARGHVVAMTGDGVNDVLALKNADLGIAMGSGSPATRSVADLVLTDDRFASLPVVVAEGRKVINNVERVANLFVTKASYAVLITVLAGILSTPFPFLPRQLTLIGTFSIGVPGFFLALAPEVERVRDGFLPRVLRFSIPAGIVAGAVTFTAFETARRSTDLDLDEVRSLATIVLLGIGLAVLAVASRPFATWKLLLVAAMAAGYAAVMAIGFTREFFQLDLFDDPAAWTIAIGSILVGALLVALVPLVNELVQRPNRRASRPPDAS